MPSVDILNAARLSVVAQHEQMLGGNGHFTGSSWFKEMSQLDVINSTEGGILKTFRIV